MEIVALWKSFKPRRLLKCDVGVSSIVIVTKTLMCIVFHKLTKENRYIQLDNNKSDYTINKHSIVKL